MSDRSLDAVRKWRDFASNVIISWGGNQRTWAEHIDGPGYADEKKLIQPVVFPAFAERLLGFTHLDLAAEDSASVDDSSKPDFTPADSVTHKFVFETKGTSETTTLSGHDQQITKYLTQGKSRIRWVVLTNLVGIRVFQLNHSSGDVEESFAVNLKGLLAGFDEIVAQLPDAERLADFLDQFSKRDLTHDEKLERVKTAPPWNPILEVTSSQWILARIDLMVQSLTADVHDRVNAGWLTNPIRVDEEERDAILSEVRLLAARLGIEDSAEKDLAFFLAAAPGSDAAKAVDQFCAHTAYFTATRLLLVRVWEDLELLAPMLYDGGFRDQMVRFNNVVAKVVAESFDNAKTRYRALFERKNNYTWYEPSDDTYVDVIYQIANTYLGDIRSDVLGQVYERMLDRIDRKLLGQYYTPRDIIRLIWDLIDLDAVAQVAEAQGREPRILDIATGSGGFLVEAASRLRARLDHLREQGATIDHQQWVNALADGLNGVEVQRFSAYLAELNLLVQFGQVATRGFNVAIPSLGVLMADTLSLYEPTEDHPAPAPTAISQDRSSLAKRLSQSEATGNQMDVAVGNPPYIGEKLAATMLARTRADYPYWEKFVAAHPDYLYNFLIVGISKLREGGRFGFITTEYWLRAGGAAPLRRYLAARCHIDQIVLFRDLRLFPDAMGQHSLIVIGTRITSSDATLNADEQIQATKPVVSIYEGPSIPDPDDRVKVIAAIREGKTAAGVRTFNARVSPNTLGGDTWFDVTLTQAQLKRRRFLASLPQVEMVVSKGVETTVNALSPNRAVLLSQKVRDEIGGDNSRPGIQLLKRSEVSGLGNLNDEERKVLRKVINTKDVYPYAAIIADDADSVIYLPKPTIAVGADRDTVRAHPFPPGLPALRAHLERFQPVLLDATVSRNENRPWWTLHRPRTNVLGVTSTGNWENFALTARWGGGQRLVVGLAPGGTSPASGLHVLRPESTTVQAAYLCGIYNSSVYQEVAATLPPGQLRAEDLERLGLPHLADEVGQITAQSMDLASIVTKLIRTHMGSFPELGRSLRGDVSLKSPPVDVWNRSYDASLAKGPLPGLGWVDSITKHGALNQTVGRVATRVDVFGPAVDLHAGQGDKVILTILVGHAYEAVLPSFASVIRGRLATGGKPSDVLAMQLPVDPDELDRDWVSDVTALTADVAKYHAGRQTIEDMLLHLG
jgi:type I restriction-modification system DNA methylase subunit